MSNRNTVWHSMHDLGLAAWFGGSLMGAVGLNGAANDLSNRYERAQVSARGWGRWSPVNAAAIGAHLVGGAGLLAANRGRLVAQQGVATMTLAKSVLTAAALATTAYSGVLGRKVAQAGPVPAEGSNVPAADTPAEVAQAQQQLRVVQWVIPVLTGALVVVTAFADEQQTMAEQRRGVVRRLVPAA